MAFRDLGIAHLKSKASPPNAECDASRSEPTPSYATPRRVYKILQRIMDRVTTEILDVGENLLLIAFVLVLLYAVGLR